MDHSLNEYELEVLRILNGEMVPGWIWGAAMSECLQELKAGGYAAGLYHITDKGKDLIAQLPPYEPPTPEDDQ